METNDKKNEPEHRHATDRKTPSIHHTEHEGDYSSPDKYLAMEQPGVSYTGEKDYQVSDQMEYPDEDASGTFDPQGENSLNADAFKQDDYVLRDNVDLDEDQSQSISSDEDSHDTNGGDGL